jgi:uncharacterized membrane-anchored protein
MNKKLSLVIIAIAAAQLAVPLSMIWAHERTLREGMVLRFACEPVDPIDAFRGRYIRVSVGAPLAPWMDGDLPRRHSDPVYAVLDVGEDGHARVIAATSRPPSTGAYVRARNLGLHHADRMIRLELPIERFYLPEHEAPAAEQAYLKSLVGEACGAVVVARVRRGHLVVEDLLIHGASIRSLLRAQARADATTALPNAP